MRRTNRKWRGQSGAKLAIQEWCSCSEVDGKVQNSIGKEKGNNNNNSKKLREKKRFFGCM
tara:strand:- start:40 stop:219 length:180 start_codon:yes stop_codon:yes gene_type:complete